MAQLDLAYHDVHRGRGLYYLLQRRGAVERAVSDVDIFEAKSVPPQTTQAQRTVLCKDPFRSVDERVEKLIAGM